MDEFVLFKNFSKNKKYRKSFSNLASDIFGLNFELWFAEGYCNENYITYSYIYNEKVISNVSINKFTIMQDGEIKKVIQLGTVMTDSNYRNKGLIRRLINEIFKDYKNKVDYIYLFANNSVLDFYTKFGFNRKNETEYKISMNDIRNRNSRKINYKKMGYKNVASVRRLNLSLPTDKIIMERLCKDRYPVSNKFGIIKDEWPLKVYCNYIFNNNLYYFQDDDIVVILERKNDEVIIYDIISKNPIDIDNILIRVIESDDKNIKINFIPESNKFKVITRDVIDDDNALFIKNCKGKVRDGEILFPVTSHT
ncbi:MULTISPECIES: GNAT family N-acetyltransferase [Clostridium]|uniref:GNAT family N-acetyltransferase n=1 Tax=Clostridium TaxID=1485 RepID=UPI0018992738|nr:MULTISPECIES: GNAT family N-acetyltransferase [Clostridium]MDI9215389.1 GNAT family N-acetyltransferase [Clostridium tertium]